MLWKGNEPMLRNQNGLMEKEFLEQYTPGAYPRPSLTVDMIVFSTDKRDSNNYRKLPTQQLQVLLIRRGGHPYLGKWALPGGFVEPEETVGQAANRELMEETGLADQYLEQLYTFSTPGRDPRTWVVCCAHMALVNREKLSITSGDDATDAAWFDLHLENGDTLLRLESEREILCAKIDPDNIAPEKSKIIENTGIAFDHPKMIVHALRRLRDKIEYTDLAFHFAPEYFTLTELQNTHEAILGRKLIPAVFRRKIAAAVEETEQYAAAKGHRPSKLYRRKHK